MINKNITESEGSELVKTARNVVTEYLQRGKKKELDPAFKSNFSFKSGVFVTLNNPQGLRGCIGNPLPDKELFNALTDAAISAAISDPRFSSVTTHELNQITFEVTIITPPVEIIVKDTKMIPSKIKIGRDGLIVTHQNCSGLLLPQVALKFGWDEKEFLCHTCEKAGLAPEKWMDSATKILKFQGLIFKEVSPNGKVVREEL